MKKIKNNPALKELFMDRYTDESLLKMFNEVANTIIPSKSDNWYQLAKKGTKINGVKFINKTHNTPSVTDTNQDMANYSLKLLRKKRKK